MNKWNMKYLILVFVCNALIEGVYSQPTKPFVADRLGMPGGYQSMSAIDSGNIKIWYAMNAEDIHNTDTYYDWQCLEIGSQLTKYYSFWVYTSDSLLYDWGKKKPNAGYGLNVMGLQGTSGGRWSEYLTSLFFKNPQTNTLKVYGAFPMWRGPRGNQYTEVLPVQEWTLQDETTTISGYQCQKATCHFRGRDYEAWFALDIPINNGPWKFGGLPGLILKVYDTNRLYVFECTKIRISRQKFPILMYDEKNYTSVVDRKKLLKLHHDIHINYPRAASILMSTYPDEPPYHPLELE